MERNLYYNCSYTNFALDWWTNFGQSAVYTFVGLAAKSCWFQGSDPSHRATVSLVEDLRRRTAAVVVASHLKLDYSAKDTSKSHSNDNKCCIDS